MVLLKEILILKLAVKHNNGIINLCSRKEAIRSLIVKGLIHVATKGYLIVDEIVTSFIESGNKVSSVIFENGILLRNETRLKEEFNYNI